MCRVYNKSRCEIVPAKFYYCPRCKGFGSNFHDAKDDKNCFICNGEGSVWVAEDGSGWTRSKYLKLDKSTLY